MVNGSHADRTGAFHIGQDVVDEYRLGRAEIAGAADQLVDGAIGLRMPDQPGNHVVAKQPEERVPSPGRVAKPGIEQIGGVRQQEEGRAGRMQPLDQCRHLGKGMVAHLVEPVIKGAYQLGPIGVQGLQAPGGFDRVASMILDGVPFVRRHFGKEALHLGRIGEQLAIEVAGVPIDQDAAEIEDDGGWLGQAGSRTQIGSFQGQI